MSDIDFRGHADLCRGYDDGRFECEPRCPTSFPDTVTISRDEYVALLGARYLQTYVGEWAPLAVADPELVAYRIRKAYERSLRYAVDGVPA